MWNLFRTPCILFTATFLFAGFAHAAEIHFVGSATDIAVLAPTTSVAYFGELDGSPATFVITAEEAFTLESSILVPDIKGATRDFSVTIREGAKQEIATFSGRSIENLWQHWFEAWTGQWYWRGAEFKSGLPADTYFLTVSNPKNTGKYILMIGGGTPTPDSVGSIVSVENFFGNPSAVLQSRTGGLMFLALLLLAGFLWLWAGR